jgi:hypothetical protein
MVVALIVVGFVGLLVLAPTPAIACSCQAPTPALLMENNPDVVFVGAPVRLVLEADGPFGTERLWEFDVKGVYLGDVGQGLAVSGGSGGDGGCEVAFNEDYGEVAVAARWTSGHLRTGICSTMSGADFVAAMGPGDPAGVAADAPGAATSNSGPPTALIALVVAAVALAVAGLVAIVAGRSSVARSETDR